MKMVGVYGASGFGREVMPVVQAQMRGRSRAEHDLVFIDDQLFMTMLNGLKVMNWQEFLSASRALGQVCVAVANSTIREALATRCSQAGVELLSVRAENAVVMDDVMVGEGAILCPFVTLTSNIRIGRFFHANLYSYVAHDCVIGDFVTFAPAVRCNGNVVIEDHAYIGTGAILRQGKPGEPLVIGRGAVVGMGAVVTKSVPPGVTVIGNPARPLVKD